MQIPNKPCPENSYQQQHTKLLLSSYHRITGRHLIAKETPTENQYLALFEVPFCVVSHGIEDDPIFNYGNRAALNAFEMSWPEFTKLPSRKSAEPVNREERARLLANVAQNGFVDDYHGVRISSTGKRFRIETATIWNLIDESDRDRYRGQAAVLYKWSGID